ncbi:MAG: DUF992 domain-containing protein [Variibacter sp.]|nr:DUF992 domain-containing protein [Variibacter sp.]
MKRNGGSGWARLCGALGALMLAALLAAPAQAQSRGPSRLQLGTLDCDISGGFGLIIASRKEVTCMFTPAGQAPREVYVGVISKFGLDLGGTSGGRMVWAVYAETTLRRGALTGAYVGASAEATVAVGLGANVLVGGSNRTIALQPLSFQGQSGLNVAAGVTELQLSAAQ